MDTFIKGVRVWVKKQEIKELITQEKYELIKVRGLDSGIEIYLYKFKLSDGEELAKCFMRPLDSEKNREGGL